MRKIVGITAISLIVQYCAFVMLGSAIEVVVRNDEFGYLAMWVRTALTLVALGVAEFWYFRYIKDVPASGFGENAKLAISYTILSLFFLIIPF